MIELSDLIPGFGGMANTALSSKLALVFIFICMAGKTILRGVAQVVQVARVDVTFGAGCLRVDPFQFERDLIMVEV